MTCARRLTGISPFLGMAGHPAEADMAIYQEYIMASTLDEAYALNQKKSAVIVAGNMWLRMCKMRKKTAIDLSALGLDKIEEREDAFVIGAMTTLRQLEKSEALNGAFGGVFEKALSPIVGTQFRNTATVGGSVYSRFGFSDVSTVLLAMGASMVLHKRGEVPLEVFQQEKPDRDILTHVVIPKGQRAGVASVRMSETDIPALVCAAAVRDGKMNIAVGARPARAVLAAKGVSPDLTAAELGEIAQNVMYGGNMRAGKAYRERVAPVLMARAAAACREV